MLPLFQQALEMITNIIKKKPWHTYKRGRKRHGLYRKQVWCKKEPRNTYEPRIVPKFVFDKYKEDIPGKYTANLLKKNSNLEIGKV